MDAVKFQDRRLNHCAVCGTNRRLAITSTSTGKLYFLCESHYMLDKLMRKEVLRMGIRVATRKEG